MKSCFLPIIATAGIALALANPCIAQPATVASARPPAIPRNSPQALAVPQTYVWDGFEFVGRVGSQYYYIGPNNTWMVLDGVRLRRFQRWQKADPNWQQRQIRNTRYFQIQPVPAATPLRNPMPPMPPQ